MVLIIDNYDSFTWNLAHRLGELGAEVEVVRNDALTQGPKLFAKNCASCHRYDGHDGLGGQPKDKISAADLNRKVAAFREIIQNPRQDARPIAQELYKILLGKMADDLRKANAQTLMWSLDGTLRYVPLAALFDGKNYLMERYRLAVYTSASKPRLKDRPDAEWKALGLAV